MIPSTTSGVASNFVDAIHCPDLQHPLQLEILDVVGRDLIHKAVALMNSVAAVGEPVLRFLVGVEESARTELAGRRRRGTVPAGVTGTMPIVISLFT